MCVCSLYPLSGVCYRFNAEIKDPREMKDEQSFEVSVNRDLSGVSIASKYKRRSVHCEVWRQNDFISSNDSIFTVLTMMRVSIARHCAFGSTAQLFITHILQFSNPYPARELSSVIPILRQRNNFRRDCRSSLTTRRKRSRPI